MVTVYFHFYVYSFYKHLKVYRFKGNVDFDAVEYDMKLLTPQALVTQCCESLS